MRASFPQLNEGYSRNRQAKPASRLGNASRALQQDESQTSVGPQKRRRQLTQKPPQIPSGGNLAALVGKALRGK